MDMKQGMPIDARGVGKRQDDPFKVMRCFMSMSRFVLLGSFRRQLQSCCMYRGRLHIPFER